MNTNQAESKFKNLKMQLYQLLPEMKTFITNLNERKRPDNYLIYDFQRLMDSLCGIKERADQVTRTLDHG